MEKQKHINTVGLLYIIFGSIGLVFSSVAAYVGINDVLRISATEVKSELHGKVIFYIWIGLFAILVLSLSFIFVGRGIREGKRWATRVFGFILALLALPSFPIGTVIGIYAIWALNKVIKDEPITIQT